MPSTDLVPTLPGRPAYLREASGAITYLSYRDLSYLADLRRWKFRLAQAHPDGNGTAAKFHAVHRAYTRWRSAELTWYQSRDLDPPTETDAEPSARPDGLAERLVRYLQQHVRSPTVQILIALGLARQHGLSLEELAVQVGRPSSAVIAAVARLRQAGVAIETSRCGHHHVRYRLEI